MVAAEMDEDLREQLGSMKAAEVEDEINDDRHGAMIDDSSSVVRVL